MQLSEARGKLVAIGGGAMTCTSLPYSGRGDGLSLHGVRVHVLSAGSRFDLSKREPVVEKDDEAPQKKGKMSEDDKSEKASQSSTRKSVKKSKGK